jgi:hypothetical protein
LSSNNYNTARTDNISTDAMNYLADDFINKPVEPEVFNDRINKILKDNDKKIIYLTYNYQ